MRRLSLTFALLTLSPALAQEKVSFQPVPLPYVTLSAPGYAVRAEVRPAVTYPESGPNVGPYFQFSPSQVRVVLDRAGQARWKSQFPADMPPAYVTVTPVQNWLTLYKGPSKAKVNEQLSGLRDIISGKRSPTAQRGWKELPYLPLTNTAQVAAGAIRRVQTPQLQGVRYLAIRGQEMLTDYPRSGVFYTFQGLSRDGKYVISVRLPYAPASFPVKAGEALLPEAGGLQTMGQMSARLDAEDGKLAALDRLAQSIRIR